MHRDAAAADTDSDTGPHSELSRPASLWPDSVRGADTRAGAGRGDARVDLRADDGDRVRRQAAAAFDVCHPSLALRAVLLVQAALAIVALAGAQSPADWSARQAASAFGGVVATLLWLVVVCGLRRALARLPPAPRAAAVMAIGGAAALLAWLPLWWAGLAGSAGGLRAVGVAIAGIALSSLVWAWLDLRARIWHPAQTSARLAELQSRIRPHFLFNALNSALALVRADPERAEAVLEDLAELFRAALAESGVSVALADEIELARRYLAIEQVRFGDRLQLRWDIAADPRVQSARVPPLVLQPLVENAVRHGIEPLPAGGRVSVRAAIRRGQVVVEVSNTVGDGPASPGNGIALASIRERLRLLHDVAAQCDVRRESSPAGGGVFHARIVLPAP